MADPIQMAVAFLLSKSSITAVVSQKVFGPRGVDDSAPPLIIVSTRGGNSHPDIKEERRFSLQVDCYSTGTVAARTLFETVRDAFFTVNNQTVSGSRLVAFTQETEGVDLIDPTTEWPGVRSFWEMMTL